MWAVGRWDVVTETQVCNGKKIRLLNDRTLNELKTSYFSKI